MKQFILIASIALLASCGSNQDATTLETPVDTTCTTIDSSVEVTVTYCDTPCVDSIVK